MEHCGVDEKGLGVQKTDTVGDTKRDEFGGKKVKGMVLGASRAGVAPRRPGPGAAFTRWRPGTREDTGHAPALPGQGRLQLLFLLGQLHLELSDLSLQVGNLFVEVTGLALQLPFQLLQLLPVLLLLLQPHCDKARGLSGGGSPQKDTWRGSLPIQAFHTEGTRTVEHTHTSP